MINCLCKNEDCPWEEEQDVFTTALQGLTEGWFAITPFPFEFFKPLEKDWHRTNFIYRYLLPGSMHFFSSFRASTSRDFFRFGKIFFFKIQIPACQVRMEISTIRCISINWAKESFDGMGSWEGEGGVHLELELLMNSCSSWTPPHPRRALGCLCWGQWWGCWKGS